MSTTTDADLTVRSERPERTRPSVASRLLNGVLIVVLGALVLLLVVTVGYPKAKDYVPLTILSGSMQPTYPIGSQVYVERIDGADDARDKVRVGTPVTFMPKPDDPTLVTHRVIAVSARADGTPVYRTQGDANSAADPWEVTPTQLRGVVRYHVPYVGYVATSLGQDSKTTLAKGIAAGLFIYALWNLRGLRRRRDESGPASEPR